MSWGPSRVRVSSASAAAGPVAAATARWREPAAVLGTWMVGALVFFRGPVFSGFDRISGTDADTRLIALLHEHWLDVVRGRATWNTPAFFHPTNGTLGYSDTFVLNEIFYAPLRALGFDRYGALQVTMIALSLLGFVGYYVVGTRLVEAGRGLALAMASVAVFANGLSVQVVHPQMSSVHYLPWLVLLVAAACRASSERRRAAAAGAAGLLFGLLVWSTYYVGWFAAFAGGLLLVGLAVQMRRRLRAAGARRIAARLWRPLAAAAAGAALPLAGFLATYVPTLRTLGGRRFSDAFYYSPGPADLINVGGGNLFWGGPVRAALGDRRAGIDELGSAVTPLVALALIAVAVVVFVRLRRADGPLVAVTRALLVVVMVLPLLTVHIGEFTLWRAVWLVPGASGVRAIVRLQLVAAYLAPLGIMCGLTCLRARHALPVGRWWRAALIVAALVLVVEQTNTRPAANLERQAELDRIASTPTPPPDCDSFFLVQVPNRFHYAMSLDAMLIAQRYQLPTINGYSGAIPPEWTVRQDRGVYLDSVQAWVDLHGLEHVCSYDEVTRVWTLDAVEAN